MLVTFSCPAYAVSLAHRDLPVIELLKAAAKANCNVRWDSSN